MHSTLVALGELHTLQLASPPVAVLQSTNCKFTLVMTQKGRFLNTNGDCLNHTIFKVQRLDEYLN